VCHWHGARSPQAERKAAERLAEAKAAKTAARWSEGRNPADLNPVDELLKVAGKIVAFQEAIEGMLAELPEGEWRRDHRAGEQLHALVSLFERSLDRCAKVLVDVNKLNLEEQRVRIMDREAMVIVSLVKAILGRLQLSPEQRKLASSVVPDEMRAVAAREAAGVPAQRSAGHLRPAPPRATR